MPNVFVDDRGFPDKCKYYKNLLHNVEGGPILCKLNHPPPLFDEMDPTFFCAYVESTHCEQLQRDLYVLHLEPHVRDKVYPIIQKYWSVFNDKNIFIPVKNYECVIDTGDAQPIAVKKIIYGPKETPIMQDAFAALAKVGHMQQIHNRRLLLKALVAPKPHQEHVRDIDKFVWRFCINYILLNSVTRIIDYPIPHCNSSITEEFSQGVFFWLWDAPMGYHQLALALASQEKLAFQGPNTIKWTYIVMPFSPKNGPATFITFIHNIDSQWKAMAQQKGLIIYDNTNTKIIVDNIFSWAKSLFMALIYIECQLWVCQAYGLSLSLQKSHIFPKRFEFFGIDVYSDGNRPAMLKHQLLEHWPQPETVRDVAKIIRFAQFYSKVIPQFELWIAPLCNLTTKLEYTNPVSPHWMTAAQDLFNNIEQAILSDPCLKHFNHQCLTVL